ncbi:hypothetical protein ABZU53_12845 [Micromonospora sp. NPDC005194]|uniref:hypothetical protein n=1 Tax=Micromonospora sp. NPDC005194 TaxID=3156870 RepID=UPI0033B8469A
MHSPTPHLTGGDYLAASPETVRLGYGLAALCGVVELIGDAARFSVAQSLTAVLPAVSDRLCAAAARSEICGERPGSRSVPR